VLVGLAGMLVGLGAAVMSRRGMLLGEVMTPVTVVVRGFSVMMSGGLVMCRSAFMVFGRRMGRRRRHLRLLLWAL
jgi:hypothetical protein